MSSFKFKNYDICYDVQGVGKPILILNGIMMNIHSWDALLAQLKGNNTIVRLDMLDQGLSSKMVNIEYTLADQVLLIKALLDELHLDKISIVGVSYGGEVAMHFAAEYPCMVERLVLANTAAYTSPWLVDIGKAWNMAAETGNGEAYYYTSIPVIYSPKFYEEKLDWMRNREKILFPVFGNKDFTAAMIRLTNSANNHNVLDKLAHISAPTLIIGADQDYLTPFPQQELLNSKIKDSKLVKISNCGHASMYEQPLIFTSLALGFININDVNFKI